MSENKLTVSVVLEAIDKMTAPVRRILGVTSSLEDQLAATRRQLRDLNTTSKDITGFDKLQIRLTKTNADLIIAQAAYDKLSAKIKESGNASEAELAQLTKKQLRLQELQEKQRKYSQALAETKQRLTESGISTDKLADEQASLKNRIEQTTASLDRQNAAMAKSATHQKQLKQAQAARDQMYQRAQALTVSGAGAMYSARGVIQNTVMPVASAAIDDEAAFASVKKVVDFTDAADAQAYRNKIQKMSMDIPISATGLYEISAQGGQLGVAKDELADFTRNTAVMATAFDMLPSQAGDAAAKISNIFQIPKKEMVDVGDAVNHLSNNTAAKANEILDVMNRTGGISKQFGLTPIQNAALSDSFLALGKSPEVAGTGINALLGKMQTATIQSKSFKRGLKDIGLSAEELERKVQKNGQAALLEFLKTLEKLPKEKQMNVIGQLFGAEYADDISALVGGLKEYEKALELVSDASKYAGSMQKEFEAKSSTTQAGLKRLENQTTALKVEMGSALLPVINELLQEIRPLIESTMQWARENPELVKTLMLSAVAIAGVVAAGGALTMAMASVLGPIAMVRYGMGLLSTNAAGGIGIIGRLTSMFRALWGGLKRVTFIITLLGRLLLMNPIGIAVALIAGGAILIYRNWDKLVNWWNSWTLRDVGVGVGKLLRQAADWIQNRWTALQNWWNSWTLRDVGVGVGDYLIKAADWVKEKWGNLVNWWNNLSLKSLVPDIKMPSASWVGDGWNKIKSSVKSFGDGVKAGYGGGRATGGPVYPGHFYEVNERGIPELIQYANKTLLMMGSQAGRVIPLRDAANDLRASSESRFASPKVADMLAIKAQQNHSRSSRVDAPMNVQITINAAPGMDERAVADAVGRKLQQLERERERRMRGRLYDEAG